jgi:hypothetical protein
MTERNLLRLHLIARSSREHADRPKGTAKPGEFDSGNRIASDPTAEAGSAQKFISLRVSPPSHGNAVGSSDGGHLTTRTV